MGDAAALILLAFLGFLALADIRATVRVVAPTPAADIDAPEAVELERRRFLLLFLVPFLAVAWGAAPPTTPRPSAAALRAEARRRDNPVLSAPMSRSNAS
jgi:hypothetical protein